MSDHNGTLIELLLFCLEYKVPGDHMTLLGKSPFAAVVTGLLSTRDWNTTSFLLRNGADVNWSDENGLTPLHLMASARLWEFDYLGLEKLIVAGADREALDKDGLSPLHYAAARDNRRAMAVIMQIR